MAKINSGKLFIVADIRVLEKLVALGEISYSRMVELLNEKAAKYNMDLLAQYAKLNSKAISLALGDYSLKNPDEVPNKIAASEKFENDEGFKEKILKLYELNPTDKERNNDACDDDYDDSEDDFEPCANCDLPDACADFGCAIKQGIRKNFDLI